MGRKSHWFLLLLYKRWQFWFRKSLILKSLEPGKVPLHIYINLPALPFVHAKWEWWVTLQMEKVSHPASNKRSLFPWKATECVQPCLRPYRWGGKHAADGPDPQMLQTGVIPLKSSEFIQFPPPENAAYCSNLTHLPAANICIENRFREGEIDSIIPDILSVGRMTIYLVSDQTYQLWTKFHNCRRLCVAICNNNKKKNGIVHYGLTYLYVLNSSCRPRELLL